MSKNLTQRRNSDKSRASDAETQEGFFFWWLCSFALLSIRTLARREDFGVRWQSAAATLLFDCGQSFQSGVALRFPPQSKKNRLRLCAFAPLR
jgi:hypothetical protein